MKILFIAPRFVPELGGVEKHVKSLSDKLFQKGNDVTVITTASTSLNEGTQLNNGIRVIRKYLPTRDSGGFINVIRNLSTMSLFLVNNLSLIKKNDIIHLHDVSSFLWIMLVHFFIRHKLYITFHGYEGYPLKKRDILARKLAEKLSQGNICVGRFLEKWYGTKPNMIILGGIEEPRKIVTNRSIPALYIGRLAEDTSVAKYLECLKILRDCYRISLELHICGDGPLLETLIKFAKSNSLQIEFHGFVSDTYNFISRSKYVFASGYLSILEAMSYKRPVFCIYETPLKKDYYYSIPEVEEKMYVEDSPEKLAKDLYEFLETPDEKKLEEGYNFAMSNKWESIADVYLKLWEKQ